MVIKNLCIAIAVVNNVSPCTAVGLSDTVASVQWRGKCGSDTVIRAGRSEVIRGWELQCRVFIGVFFIVFVIACVFCY